MGLSFPAVLFSDRKAIMKPISNLTVIECPYRYNGWSYVFPEEKPVLQASLRKLEHRTTEIYHQADIYSLMGVPVSVRETNPDDRPDLEPAAAVIRSTSDYVCEAISHQHAVLFAGGYCNYAPAIVGGIQRAAGSSASIGILWIDAHADCRIPRKDSLKPVRLVSIPVSTLTGMADSVLADYRKDICGLETPVPGENIFAGDLRAADEESLCNIASAHITRITAENFRDPEKWRKAVDELANRTDLLYVSVDADILEPKYIPAYVKVVDGGHTPETVAQNVAYAASTGKLCALSLFCFNFDIETGSSVNAKSAMTIMARALQSWNTMPEITN